jgi:hypothetical protein
VTIVPHPSPNGSAIATTDLGGSPASLKYNVEFFDRNGKLLNIQQFNSKEEAEQFKHDFDAAQASPAGSDWNVVPTINKF